MDRAPRSDAVESRRALLDAFAELVVERGADVPMYVIAQRARVGQGTLYRHFPTRSTLASALFERNNDDLEALAAQHADDPHLLDRLLRAVAANQARLHALSAGLIRDEASEESVTHLTERTRRLFADPLQRAQAAGFVRADVTTDDVLTVTAMIEGVLIGAHGDAAREAATSRALDLVWSGLSARPGTTKAPTA